MNDEQKCTVVQKMRDIGNDDRMMLTAYKGMQGGDSDFCQTTLLLHISRSLELNTDALNRIASALDKLNAIYDAKMNETVKIDNVYSEVQ